MRKTIYTALLLCLLSLTVNAQDTLAHKMKVKKAESDYLAMGFGVGLDYGGLGANLTAFPQKNLGIFGGVGYTPVGLGYNVGVKLRLLFNEKKPNVSPFIMGMYGYYAAVKIKGGGSDLSTQFHGYTVGAGFDTPIKPTKAGYWSFAILVPLRGTVVDDYVKKNGIILDQDLPPIGVSIGYKVMVGRR